MEVVMVFLSLILSLMLNGFSIKTDFREGLDFFLQWELIGLLDGCGLLLVDLM